jgi:hypothetical protein
VVQCASAFSTAATLSRNTENPANNFGDCRIGEIRAMVLAKGCAMTLV